MYGRSNLILNVDSYKASQYLQFPPGTQYVSSYIEARSGSYPTIVYFGLQMFLKEYLCKPVSHDDIERAADLFADHGMHFNPHGWRRIVEQHGGLVPVRIDALPEGSVLPPGNVLLQIVNTDPQCAWLPSYLETALLRAVWYPTTVATHSRYCRNLIQRYLQETGEDEDSLEFKLHDFGARGVSSFESSALGGLAHLLSFKSTDTVSGLVAGQQYYGADMPGFSVPAADHASVTAWGREFELQAYQNMLDQFSGKGKALAVVSDSYDLWNAVEHLWGEALFDQVRDQQGVVMVRPDSGDPVDVVCKTIHKLMVRFGSRENSKGFLVLPDCIRVIQGDGISASTIQSILERMKWERLSADNVAFGMGGDLLQRVNRDTLDFTMKVSAVNIHGEWRDVCKDPLTGRQKRSKKGRLALVHDADGYQTIRLEELGERNNQLQTVFENGRLCREEQWAELRQRSIRSMA